MVFSDYPRALASFKASSEPAMWQPKRRKKQDELLEVPAAMISPQREPALDRELDDARFATEYQQRLLMATEASLREHDEAMMRVAQRASLEEASNHEELAMEASRLAAKAVQCGLHEVQMPRDGNCQFHSTAHALNEAERGEKWTHVSVRKRAVQWLREHGEHFRLNEEDSDTTLGHYLDGDATWAAYCDRMDRPGQYGDHLTLIAIGECFSCCVVVITSDAEGVNYHTKPRDSTPLETIHLAHYPVALHYNLLQLQGEPSVDSSLELGVHFGQHLTTGFAYKVQCPNGQLRRIRTEYDVMAGRLHLGHAELRAHIARLCAIEDTNLLLTWRDADGDIITFDTDEELLDAVRCAAASGQKVLRIFVQEGGESVMAEQTQSKAINTATTESSEWCLVEPIEEVEGRVAHDDFAATPTPHLQPLKMSMETGKYQASDTR